jgi:U6 snRNA-associated Sm-like protein LSm6
MSEAGAQADVGATTNGGSPQAAASAQPAKGSPNDFLKKVIGKSVIVRLNSGVDYHGESQLWQRTPCTYLTRMIVFLQVF